MYEEIIIEKLLSQIQETINRELIIDIMLSQISIPKMESNLMFLVIIDLLSLMDILQWKLKDLMQEKSFPKNIKSISHYLTFYKAIII